MFVIILFQDAHEQISKYQSKSTPLLLIAAAIAFVLAMLYLGNQLSSLSPSKGPLPDNFGMVQSLGKALYVDFFFHLKQ